MESSCTTQSPYDLTRFREYLCLLVRMQVDRRLQGKLDTSGVVQQTLLDAYNSRENLAGRSDAEHAAWLRRALANNLADAIDRLKTAKRQSHLEVSLERLLDQSSSRVRAWLEVEQSSPSEHAVRHEQTMQLVVRLQELPENQRVAIELRHLQGRSLIEVAEAMQTTRPCVPF